MQERKMTSALYLLIMSVLEIHAVKFAHFSYITNQDNVHRYDTIDSMVDSRGLIECGTICSQKDICLSFAFNYLNMKCALYTNSFRCVQYVGNYGSQTGWVHYDSDVGLQCPCNYDYEANVRLCYRYIPSNGYDWNTANKTCYDEGGYIIKIDSAERQTFMETFLESFASNDRMWIQGYRSDGQWRYDDGTVMTYFNWYNTNPSDPEPDNTPLEVVICLIQATQSTWHDRYIIRTDSGVICEIPI